jgi:hypothetical protein
MPPIAHIGNVPVEEWLPFLVPVVALYVYGRHAARRRQASVARLPGVEALTEANTERVLAKWSSSHHAELSREFVPLLYPPGPEGMTAAELAARIHADVEVVRARLEDLADLDYLELDVHKAEKEPRAWLTVAGHDLLGATEAALLAEPPGSSSRHAETGVAAQRGQGRPPLGTA